MTRTLILGGPGAGKTTRLLDIMEEAISRGVAPEKIAFVAFTRAAAREARERAQAKFGLDRRRLPYFRTLHSLAFRAIGASRSDLFEDTHRKELSDILHEDLEDASPLVRMDGRARVTERSLEEIWRENDDYRDVNWYQLKRFSEALARYKNARGLLDFTDLLEAYAHNGAPVPVEVAIVDEVQDLSNIQYGVCERAFSETAEAYYAGDDDQSIHVWAGASVDRFLNLPYEREVLPRSYRLPKRVFDLSQRIVHRIKKRYEKNIAPADRTGSVKYLVNLDRFRVGDGTWLLLARTRRQLEELIELARLSGVPYAVMGISAINPDIVRTIRAYERLRRGLAIEADDAARVLQAMGFGKRTLASRLWTADALGISTPGIWHDALVAVPIDERKFYVACLKRGENLFEPPRVRISTIHGAKGLEAENVLLLGDLTRRPYEALQADPDSEHRVLYVGITRALENLYVRLPRRQGYEF